MHQHVAMGGGGPLCGGGGLGWLGGGGFGGVGGSTGNSCSIMACAAAA